MFIRKFDVLCFLVTTVFKISPFLPYYRRYKTFNAILCIVICLLILAMSGDKEEKGASSQKSTTQPQIRQKQALNKKLKDNNKGHLTIAQT